jgi:hypothetical protein
MNKETVIYIILSAMLLYLYYRRREIAIFVAFVVVAGGTLIFRESMPSYEGFIEGNTSGGNVDKDCAKLGFKPPKIQKKKWKESLVNSLKNIKNVADKYWPFNDIIGNKPKNDTAKENYTKVVENDFFKKESKSINKENNQDFAMKFIGGAVEMYDGLVNSDDKKKEEKVWKELTPEVVNKAIKGGEMYITLLKKNHENLKKNDADKDVLTLSKYLVCLAKQWLMIFKQLKSVLGSDDGDEGGEDEEDDDSDKKKKSKKSKKKKDDEDDE